jgi:hypothetical protein
VVVYIPIAGSWVPSLTTDPVSVAGPLDSVGSTSTILVVDVALSIGPEGVVEAVVHTGSVGGSLALSKTTLGAGSELGSWGSEDASDGGESEKNGGELDHFVDVNRELLSAGWMSS